MHAAVAVLVLVSASFGVLPCTTGSASAEVDAIIQSMTLEEKISQLNTDSAAIPRLGLKAFQWWSECLHGARDDDEGGPGATVFPMPITIAASFDTALMHRIARHISDEARALHNWRVSTGVPQVKHLNCFGPNLNIFRDPRWGRGAETYGEDPLLTSAMTVAFVKGLQGDRDDILQVAATCKHFAAYSFEAAEGRSRFTFDADVSERDWHDTYSIAFSACVQHASVASVMCSYNAVNGTPACANHHLLQRVLRQDWAFNSMVVSDCAAVQAVHLWHRYGMDEWEGVAKALQAGTDLSCGDEYSTLLPEAIRKGYTNTDAVDTALRQVLLLRQRLGQIPPQQQPDPWAHLDPGTVLGCPEHIAAAEEAVRKGAVLLKNHAGALPLNVAQLTGKRVVVLGAMADTPEYLLGNYYGRPRGPLVTPLQAIREALNDPQGRTVQYISTPLPFEWNSDAIMDAELQCREAELCIFVLGSVMADWRGGGGEGPSGPVPLYSVQNEAENHDRKSLKLPGEQEDAVKAAALGTKAKIVVFLIHGGPLDVEWMQMSSRVSAILAVGHPGQGSRALGDLLIGTVNPSGRLPMTWYFDNFTRQSDYLSMDMRRYPGRTYRFLQVNPLYPFGYGLSYVRLNYSQPRLRMRLTCPSHADNNSTFADTARSATAHTSAGTLHQQLLSEAAVRQTEHQPHDAAMHTVHELQGKAEVCIGDKCLRDALLDGLQDGHYQQKELHRQQRRQQGRASSAKGSGRVGVVGIRQLREQRSDGVQVVFARTVGAEWRQQRDGRTDGLIAQHLDTQAGSRRDESGDVKSMELPTAELLVEVSITNEDGTDAEEVVMLYTARAAAQDVFQRSGQWEWPQKNLRTFDRVFVPAHSTVTVAFTMPMAFLDVSNMLVGGKEKRPPQKGLWLLQVGQADAVQVLVPSLAQLRQLCAAHDADSA